MTQVFLWDVVIIEVKRLLQGGFQMPGRDERGGFQHLGDAAVEAFDHAVGLGLVGVGHQRGQNIDHGIDEAAVPGVLDLLDVVDLVVDGFDDGTLAQQQLIGQGHEFVGHVLADFGDQL